MRTAMLGGVMALLLGACTLQDDGDLGEGAAPGEQRPAEPAPAEQVDEAAEVLDDETCGAVARLVEEDDDLGAFLPFLERVEPTEWLHEQYPEEGFGPYAETFDRMQRTFDAHGADPHPDGGNVSATVDEDLLSDFHSALRDVSAEHAAVLLEPPASEAFASRVKTDCGLEMSDALLPLAAYLGPDPAELDAARLDDREPLDRLIEVIAAGPVDGCGGHEGLSVQSTTMHVQLDRIEGGCGWTDGDGEGELVAVVGRVTDEILEALDAGGEPIVTDEGDELAAWLAPDGRGVVVARSEGFEGGTDALRELLEE